MSRRTRHRLRPALERFESRELPSGIIALLASHPPARHFQLSPTSIAVPSNQGPQGTNLVLTPTGQATPHELRRETFLGTFSGTYTEGPGRFSSEARQVYIRAAGGSNQFRHGDIQIRLVTPKDPTLTIGGTSSLFDRNLNTNSVLGLDLSAPQQNVDGGGRPNHLTASLDVNTSAGTYGEGYVQGTVDIRYFPSSQRIPGVISQGKVVLKIRAQIYTIGTNFILTNSNINP